MNTQRRWWIFMLPGSIAHVPAETEAIARQQLRATCYLGAPVDTWRCFGALEMSRGWLAYTAGDTFSEPYVVAMRKAPGAACCIDDDCELSGYMAHVGECVACGCPANHAIEECLERMRAA